MTQGRRVKVERSRARGHVASNTLTLWPGVIKSRARFCLGPQQEARPNKSIPVTKNPLLLTVRFFEASAVKNNDAMAEPPFPFGSFCSIPAPNWLCKNGLKCHTPGTNGS